MYWMGHLASLAMVMVIDRFIIIRTAGKYTIKYIDFVGIMCYIEAEGEIDCTGWCIYGRCSDKKWSLWI